METTRLIEQYLDGTLGLKERSAVEERAAGNEDFRTLILMHKEVNESIRDTDFFKLHDLITGIGKDYLPRETSGKAEQERKLRSISYRLIFRVAAFLVLMAGAGFILRYTVFQPPLADRLYQKYYAVYDLDVICRSAPARNMPLDEAILSYDQGKYQDALNKLNVILSEDQQNHMAWFCKGLTLMETGDAMTAIQSFREIPVSWSSPFAEHRDWYLALALLRINNFTEASGIFERISSGGGYYSRQARQILKGIRH